MSSKCDIHRVCSLAGEFSQRILRDASPDETCKRILFPFRYRDGGGERLAVGDPDEAIGFYCYRVHSGDGICKRDL